MSVDFRISSLFTQRMSRRDEPLLSASGLLGPVYQRKKLQPRLQRIALSEKLTGELGSDKAILIDISLSGVLVAHETPREKGERVTLRFDWRGETVHAECEVARSEVHRPAIAPGTRPIYRSGLAFCRHLGSSEKVLRAMITELVERALDERRANARGLPPAAASHVQTGKIRGYLKLRFLHGVWQKVATADPLQPSDGFTVSIDEDPGQIKLLCDTYEKLAENDRELVRNMAALSIANPSGLPARRYEP